MVTVHSIRFRLRRWIRAIRRDVVQLFSETWSFVQSIGGRFTVVLFACIFSTVFVAEALHFRSWAWASLTPITAVLFVATVHYYRRLRQEDAILFAQ